MLLACSSLETAGRARGASAIAAATCRCGGFGPLTLTLPVQQGLSRLHARPPWIPSIRCWNWSNRDESSISMNYARYVQRGKLDAPRP
jgi:hypothetical protein